MACCCPFDLRRHLHCYIGSAASPRTSLLLDWSSLLAAIILWLGLSRETFMFGRRLADHCEGLSRRTTDR